MIRLWMDLGRDRLEHHHDPVASHNGEVVVSVCIAAPLIKDVEPQFGPVKRDRSAQLVDYKKWSDTVQHRGRRLEYSLSRATHAIGGGRRAAKINANRGALMKKPAAAGSAS